jgi:hypothetical protein
VVPLNVVVYPDGLTKNTPAGKLGKYVYDWKFNVFPHTEQLSGGDLTQYNVKINLNACKTLICVTLLPHLYPQISIKTPFGTPIFEKFERRPCAVSFNLLNASGMCACNNWQFYDPHPLIADVIISSFMTGVNL